ncbi:methionine adenosyltransferase 2 subunit beta-like [Saccostrea echinata]|uniref:methionine adenosyltransferase 2 subunit beta-like n=1 Tax=Saccostrea echinata TaxID=191078 RepID=UPI002A818B7C|nr:methionine adenosyltransferase 2 subunit beta-like [Saccostrea echinata]
MTKRVLVTGASGLFGRSIYKEFLNDNSWETLGLAFSRAKDKLKKVDITDENQVKEVINSFKPSVIIHSAAERKPDAVENDPDGTKKLNLSATEYICQAAKAIGAWVLYISTDYVFDGTSPPYEEDAKPNPLNKYGQSKLDGEKITLEASSDNSVLRVPILYGDIEYLSESAVTVLFEKIMTGSELIASDYEKRYPTHCGDIADAIRQLADKRLQDPEKVCGVFHWSSKEEMTKYDMSIAMASAFSLSTENIKPDRSPSKGAPRPYNTHLSCKKMEAFVSGRRTPFSEGIKAVLQPYFKK